VRAIVPQELLDDSGLANASSAVNDEAGHTIAWRIIDEIHQAVQNSLSTWILNPTLLAQPMNPLDIRQQCRFTTSRLEMASPAARSGAERLFCSG
jgi:hypothetical protein